MRAREELPSISCWVLSLLAFSLATGRWIVGVPLTLLAVLVPFLRKRLDLSFRGLSLFLAVPPLLMANLWPYQSRYQLNINMGLHGALYLFALSIFFSLRRKQRSSFAWVCLGSGALLAICGAELSREQNLALVAPYGMSVLFGLRTQIRLKRGTKLSRLGLWMGVAFSSVLVMTLTVSFVFGFTNYYGSLVIWIQSILAHQVGFSKSGRVGSVTDFKLDDRDQLVLRVYSEAPPEHLRAVAYQSYRNGKWRVLGEKKTLKALPNDREKRDGGKEKLYLLKGRPKRSKGDKADLRIQHAIDLGTNFFLPLDACALASSSGYLELYPGAVVESKEFEDRVEYRIFKDAAPFFGNGQDPIYLSLPEGEEFAAALDRFIRGNLGEMVGESRPDKIVQAVAFSLSSNFQYSLEVELNPQEDPALQFLEKDRKGHCELFATLGCLLLRRLGVPARYVAGFVCREKNPYGEFWVSRAWDAHAWVEYWEEEEGWRVAEFTPAPGLTVPRKSQGLVAIWETVQAKVFQLIRFFQETDLSQVGRRFRSAVRQRPKGSRNLSWALLFVCLAAGFFYLRALLRSRRHRCQEREARLFPHSLAAERRAFLKMEKELARRGYGKEGQETLMEYAKRLSQSKLEDKARMVSFILRYAAIRYRPFDPR